MPSIRPILLRALVVLGLLFTVAAPFQPAAAAEVASGGFTTTGAMSPTSVLGGTTATVTVGVTASTTRAALVDIEIYDAVGGQMLQRFWDAQQFSAGVARSYSVTWAVPANQAQGTYRVDVGIFRVGWSELYHWNSGAASLQVTTAAPPVTTTTAPVTTTTAPVTTTTVRATTPTVPATPTTTTTTTTVAAPTTTVPAPTTTVSATTPAGPLPIAMPSPSTLRAAPRKVYAHYFPQFPNSFENNPVATDYYTLHYNSVYGEGGKHAAYGGYFRNRPVPRAPRPAGWELEDMKTEVRQAIDAGIDGFTINIMSLNGYLWDRTVRMLNAAQAVDPNFDIVLMPDINTGVDSNQVLMADKMAELARHPSAHRLPDNRLVIAPFLAEGQTAQWWSQWIGLMNARGQQVAFVPTFLNYSANIASYASISYGASIWGGRSPATVTNLQGMAQDAHNRGLKWMHPIAIQDNRAYSGIYDEANNSEALRSMWASAHAGNAEWVQLITWNDYSEHTEFAPSNNLGWAALDLTAYYTVNFKMGIPPIVRDTIYVSHRRQPAAAMPTGGQTRRMTLRGGSSPARDQVEVLTFLRQAGAVEVRVGAATYRYNAPAGFYAYLAPLATGTVSAKATTTDGRVTAVTSPFTVVSTLAVQDLQYRFVSSGRSGTTTSPP